MLEIINGDILGSNVDYICHQVNCMNVMGAGIAKVIYTRFPEVKLEYHELCRQVNSAYDLLGRVQIVSPLDTSVKIINIFGQLNYGRSIGHLYTRYDALEKAFLKINQICAGKRIAFPYGFGCGLAGGNWETVERLMIKYLTNCHVKVYIKD